MEPSEHPDLPANWTTEKHAYAEGKVVGFRQALKEIDRLYMDAIHAEREGISARIKRLEAGPAADWDMETIQHLSSGDNGIRIASIIWKKTMKAWMAQYEPQDETQTQTWEESDLELMTSEESKQR